MSLAFFQATLIAFSLVMDSVSASIAGGIKSGSAKAHHAFKVGAFYRPLDSLYSIGIYWFENDQRGFE